MYENLDATSAAEYPYWLDIQHAFHTTLKTRLVVPLSKSSTHAMQRLEPVGAGRRRTASCSDT